MTIEIKEKGTRKFYEEVVNVVTQYRQLLYKPDGKLSDNFKKYRLLIIAMAIFFVTNLYLGVTGGFNTRNVLPIVLSILAIIAMAIYLSRMKKMVDGYLADDSPSVVTLDDDGVEINKVGSQAVRLAWDNVAFIRIFRESTCFFSKDLSGIVLSVTNDHKNEILEYLNSTDLGIKVIK